MKLPLLFFSLSAIVLAADQPFAPPQKTELWAEDVDLKTVGNETRAICTRGKDQPVILTGTNLKIVCDRLEIIALGVGDKTSVAPMLEKFKYLLATGNVQIVQGDREATCGRAEVFPLENKLLLTDHPRVTDHGADASEEGDEIEMFRGERRVHVKKGHTTLPPIKDLGFDPKQQPAPKTEAPAETKPEAKK